MLGDVAQNQTDRELLAWLDTIPFSKTAKNLTRDFSDAVLMAELLKLYYPRHVELHNYVPASNLNAKRENWCTLNRKVLAKLDMKLNKDTIQLLANASQGAIEKLLWELRTKILGENEKDTHNSRPKCNMEDIDAKISKEKVRDNLSDEHDPLDPPAEISNSLNIHNDSCKLSPSRFARFKRRICFVFSWLVRFSLIWNILTYCKLRRNDKRDALMMTPQMQNTLDEVVPDAAYVELKQELREKEEVIRILTHKIAYLEGSMKLKDLRISSLTEQIPQSASSETNQMIKSRQINDNLRSKSRLRSFNSHEIKTN